MEWREFQNSKAFISQSTVENVLRDFGVTGSVTNVQNLYLNQVFLIKVTSVDINDSMKMEKFVLKVLSSTFTKYADEIRAATGLMEMTYQCGLNEQSPLTNQQGDFITLQPLQKMKHSKLWAAPCSKVASIVPYPINYKVCCEGSAKDTSKDFITEDPAFFVIRVFSYSEGQPLSNILMESDGALFHFGEKLAKIHLALKDQTENKKLMEQRAKTYIWSLDQMPRIRDILHTVDDPLKRQLIETVIEDFKTNVLPIKEDLPKGFIHGDCTTRNVLLKTDSNSNWINSFVLLDFDDAVFSCLVYDVATAVTSILEEELTSRWSKVALFLKGYETQRSLTSKEKNVLYYCVTARIAQVLVGDQFMASSSDDHLPYILQSAGWKLLDEIMQ
ncbi:putative hydroxylysine kinase [Apostichopus japonicus]|uniref:Hydroxylysine kinase n=1 Tax=Stichopus japonicus TaxID=307972 RepID=A0A2G8L201_STIJA|nr:putative hydroxylysine kinase [Apostichopus japonicus]